MQKVQLRRTGLVIRADRTVRSARAHGSGDVHSQDHHVG